MFINLSKNREEYSHNKKLIGIFDFQHFANFFLQNFIKKLRFSILKMVIIQSKSKRKSTGGRYHSIRGKRRYEMGRLPTLTKLGDTKNKKIKTKSGRKKVKLLTSKTANLLDTKTKKYVKAVIENVVETPANRHFARRNIITKGTIIQTDKGKAKVTSRPGQDGVVNAVIIS